MLRLESMEDALQDFVNVRKRKLLVLLVGGPGNERR